MRAGGDGGSPAERYFAAAGFGGIVLLASDPRYEAARRVWNGMIDRRPALIARCRSTPDVQAAVGFARDTGTPARELRGAPAVAGWCPWEATGRHD